MGIGIDFILRGNSASFTKAAAAANNSIKDLKKGLREFDVGNGLKQALGVGGVIEGFRMAITNAQELRDEADKVGKNIDQGTRSVAELGDAFGKIGKGFKNALTDGLSFFTSIGDKARQFFQGVTQEQENAARKMVDVTGKAADEAEARLKKSREDNSPEKQQVAQEKLNKAAREGMAQGNSDEQKLVNLLNEHSDLVQKLAKTPPNTVAAKELKTAIAENEKAQKDVNKTLDKDAKEKEDKRQEQAIKNMDEMNEASRKQKEDEADKAKDVRDKFAPSVEQMAQMDVGGFASGNDPRLKARQIIEKEKFAAEAGNRGDIAGAMRLGTEAQKMRKSLEDVSGKGTALTAETAQKALENALEGTNKELEGVREQLKGMLKAQA